MPVVQGMAEFAESSGGMLEELREQARERERLMREYREEIRALKIETAKLGSQIAELSSERAKVIDLPPLRSARNVN